MNRSVVSLLMLAGVALAADGPAAFQAADAPPAFEVASVKPSTEKSNRMFEGVLYDGKRTNDPGRISYTRATLYDLLMRAYNLSDREQISGPDWLSTEPYDIDAKVPPGTETEEFRAMLRNLVAERFKLTCHQATKDLPVYEMVVGKGGPKFKETAKDSPNTPGIYANFRPQRVRLTANAQTLAALAGMLRTSAGRPIIDKTGLTATYDFTLEFSPAPPGMARDGDPPDLVDALAQQLGLKLEDKKSPFDMIVVDHAERIPTAN